MIVDIVGKGKDSSSCLSSSNPKWVVSTAYGKVGQKADKVFNLHKPEVLEPWLSKAPAVLMGPFIEGKEILPARQLIDKFGDIFHSSIAWMIGYAVHLGYTEIHLYGVDMIHGSEYGEQRDSLFYLMGYVSALGIVIQCQKGSGIDTLKKPSYQKEIV